GRAVGRALVRLDQLNLASVHVRLYLPPHTRACAAAAETYRLDRHAHLLKDGESVAQAERDAFEDGADDMRASVARVQSNQSGARVRVEVRRALAHQVRRPEHAVRAGRHRLGLLTQTLVRVAPVVVACA